MAYGGMAYVDLAANYIYARVSEQKWYQQNSNFVTTLVGFVATVLAWVGAQSFANDPRVEAVVFVLGFLLTCFGVRFTKNGWSQSQVAQLENLTGNVPTDFKQSVGDAMDVDKIRQLRFGAG